MDASRTPAPWPSVDSGKVVTAAGSEYCVISKGDYEHARACVNACDGIDPDTVPRMLSALRQMITIKGSTGGAVSLVSEFRNLALLALAAPVRLAGRDIRVAARTDASPALKPPFRAQRSWEGIVEPDLDELEEYMKRPYTRIVDAEGQTVFQAHDLFEFKAGHAEAIVAALDRQFSMPPRLDETRVTDAAAVAGEAGEFRPGP